MTTKTLLLAAMIVVLARMASTAQAAAQVKATRLRLKAMPAVPV